MHTRLRHTLPVFAAFPLAALLAPGDSAQAAFEKEEAEINAWKMTPTPLIRPGG